MSSSPSLLLTSVQYNGKQFGYTIVLGDKEKASWDPVDCKLHRFAVVYHCVIGVQAKFTSNRTKSGADHLDQLDKKMATCHNIPAVSMRHCASLRRRASLRRKSLTVSKDLGVFARLLCFVHTWLLESA